MTEKTKKSVEQEISADNQATQSQEDLAKPTFPNEVKSKQRKSMKPEMLFCLLAIIIAIIALLETLHLAKAQEQFNSFQLSYGIKAANQSQQLNAISQELSKLQISAANNTDKINESVKAFNDLRSEQFAGNNNWRLAEIKYLLVLAQYNLKLNRNPQTALAILQKVNHQLIQLDDPNSLSLRQQVIDAITTLKALPSIDDAGILIQLNSLSDQLKQMPLFINTAQGKQTTFTSGTNTETGWRKYWNQSLSTLGKLIIIRRQTQPITPLISPSQQQFLQENIQLKLSEASWALLQRNQQIFQLSLQNALDWIQTYYSVNSPVTSNTIKIIQSLMKINLQPNLPDLSTAIKQTNQLLISTQQSVSTGVQQ